MKSVFKILFFFLLLFTFVSISPVKSLATSVGVRYDNNNSNTSWQIDTVYKKANNNGSYTNYDPKRVWIPPGSTVINYSITGSSDLFDKVKWYSACVDPTTGSYHVNGAGTDVSCKSYEADSTSYNCRYGGALITCGEEYGACGGPSDNYLGASAGPEGGPSSYAINYGTSIRVDDQCPIPNDHPGRPDQSNENKFRCVKAGLYGPVDYVGCRNTCNYHYCVGYYISTINKDSRCTSVPGCGSCSVPAVPDGRGNSSACQNQNNAQITVSWNTVSGATSYDVRYRRQGATTNWDGCSNAYNCNTITGIGASLTSYVITGLLFSSTYEWQIQSHKCSPDQNSTWSGSKTADTTPTAGTCAPTCSCTNYANGACGAAGGCQAGYRKQTRTCTPSACDIESQCVPDSSCNTGTAPSCPTNICATSRKNANNRNVIDVSWNNVSGITYNLKKHNESTGGEQIYTNNVTSVYTLGTSETNGGVTYDISVKAKNSNGESAWCPNPALVITNNGNSSTCAPQTPDCDIALCGRTCSINVCGTGYKTCTYTTYSGGGSCTQVPAPNQSCTLSCPSSDYACVSDSCVCQTPATPSGLSPNGTIQPGTKNVTWNAVSGAIGYSLRIDDVSNGWTGDCSNMNAGDVCTDLAGTSYSYNFISGHSYTIWVHSRNSCGSWSISASTSVVVVTYTVVGNVFEDANGNKLKDGGDTNYAGSITLTAQNTSTGTIYNPAPPAGGTYSFSNLPAGPYTITYQGPPNGYKMIYPTPLAQFFVTVGTPCVAGSNVSGSNSAKYDANCNIDNLNFGIIYGSPWIQTGSDVFFNNGVNNQIPATADCGVTSSPKTVMSIPINGSPGIIYTGANNPYFGNGQASATNWKVGGSPGVGSYPESYTPKSSGIKSSFAYVSGILAQNGTAGTNLAGFAGCDSGSPTTTCGTSAWTNLANGVYKTSGNLTLQGSDYTFTGNKDYVFLVKGDLNINEKIHVDVGSTVFFSVSGNINVAPTVGTADPKVYPAIGVADLEGWYSTDKSFIVKGSHNCNTTPDSRLNMQGAIVVNANGSGVGKFDYSGRDLCTKNITCPVFYIEQRADFVLNAPRFLLTAPRIWREVAP